MRDIKEKLIALGYDVEADDILDDATKEAILDFQKKHKLPEGTLNFETLKALGISY